MQIRAGAEAPLTISLKPAHLRRYKDLARLLVKYGRADLGRGLDDEAGSDPAATAGPEELARDLERMGPTFIKLGQLLSTRTDLLSPPFLAALARLQDDVEPVPFGEIERVVTGELGVRLSKAFARFDSEPLAAASLGQVHRAALRDGTPVAVKVQRPGIRERLAEDLDALAEIAAVLAKHAAFGARYQLEETVEELRRTLLGELDYTQEARHLTAIGGALSEYDRIVVPRPVASYVTPRVLTMELVEGRKVTAVPPLLRLDVDGARLADQLFAAYLKQVLVDGLFHADPHPGNVLLTPDGRLALLDLGMVAHVTPEVQTQLLQLLLAISEGRGEEAADRAADLGEKTGEFDPAAFRRRVATLVGAVQDATVEQLRVGSLVLEVSRAAGESGVVMPASFTLLGKTLLNLDEVGRALDPRFDPNAAIRRHAARLLEGRFQRSATTGSLSAALLETKELVEKLPGRANRLMELIARNELKLKVDAIDENVFVEGLQKVANRIATGLILAALIVGAAMLMRVETSFRILGYPGFAMLCFLAAAGGGVGLVASIFAKDRPITKN